jgi:hypothetical protein
MFQAPKLGPKLLQRAPVVVGHTEKDLHNSAVAKRGEHERLYRDGATLKADIANVDEDLAEAIRRGNYDDVSAEIYQEPPDEFRRLGARGKMFRRLAILGGEIPFVKGLNAGQRLADKIATHSETPANWPTVNISRARRTRESAYTIFSEDVPMTRDEMISKLTAAGGNAEALATFSEDQLAETVRLHDAAVSAASRSASATVDLATFSEDQINSLTDAIADKIAGPLNAKIDAKIAANAKELKRQRIDVFCETQIRAGRIDPAELDVTAGGPTLADRLFALDDTAKIHTFSEGGTARELTQLDAEMRAISLRPARFKGEKVASGKGGVATFSEDANKNRRERLCQHLETFSESFGKIGMTKDEYAKAWDIANADERRELELGVGFPG